MSDETPPEAPEEQDADTPKQSIHYMSAKDFMDGGYLQEVNRRFLHPLGLALEVRQDSPDSEPYLGGIWDYRIDPEGMQFGEDMLSEDKALKVRGEWYTKAASRTAVLGYIIQPAGSVDALLPPSTV